MTPEAQKLLEDMRSAAADIADFTSGKSLDDYLSDKQLRRAVERSFEILGEALGQLRKLDEKLAAEITDSRKIISFRNVLIHGYGYVDDTKTWDIVQRSIPALRAELQRVAGAGH
jgi:uncharacterized protein with HEPN domain